MSRDSPELGCWPMKAQHVAPYLVGLVAFRDGLNLKLRVVPRTAHRSDRLLSE